MCGPAVAVPLIIAGAAATTGAAAALYKGYTARDEARDAADVSKENARDAERLAADADVRGAQAAGRIVSRGTEMIGRQRAIYAANMIDVTQGTAAEMQAQTRALSQLDALTAANNAAREAWGYRKQASLYRKQAGAQWESGNNAVAGGWLTVAGITNSTAADAARTIVSSQQTKWT